MKTLSLRKALTVFILILSSLSINAENIFADFTNNLLPENWRIYPKGTDYNNYFSNPIPNYFFTNKFYKYEVPALIILSEYFLATNKISNLSKIELYIGGNSNTIDSVMIDYTNSYSINSSSKWIKLRTVNNFELQTAIVSKGMFKVNIDLSQIQGIYHLRILSKGTAIIDDITLLSKNGGIENQLKESERTAITTNGNIIEIKNCNNSNICIYNISGQLIDHCINCQFNNMEFCLEKGFYIVNINNKATKISIN